VRAVELKLDLDRHWQKIAKPKTEMFEPENQGLAPDLPAIYDLVALALQTDSTRVATLEIGGSFAASDIGIRKGYHGLSHHGLSHHGKDQDNIKLLVQIELYQMEQFSRFLEKLKSVQEPESDGTLLDSTMVLLGSGMVMPIRIPTMICRLFWRAADFGTVNTSSIRRKAANVFRYATSMRPCCSVLALKRTGSVQALAH
jgi:hypothetical protein